MKRSSTLLIIMEAAFIICLGSVLAGCISFKTIPEISTQKDLRCSFSIAQKEPEFTKLFNQFRGKYQLIAIPTYDGSYQLTHPKVLFFKNGWNGYHYWMSMTPYPREADIYENPSIVVSNDGISWSTPKGLKIRFPGSHLI